MRTVKKIVKIVSLLLLMAFTFAVGNIVSAKIISGLDKKYIFDKPENRYGIVASDGTMTTAVLPLLGYINKKYNNLEWKYILTRKILKGVTDGYYTIDMWYDEMSEFESYNELLWYKVIHAEQHQELYAYSECGYSLEKLSYEYFDNPINALDTLAYIVYHEGALQGDSECLEKMEEYKAKNWNFDLSK